MALADHSDLGVHTELISDGLMDLVERGVVNGVAKQLNRTKTVGTFALGTRRLYDFLDENAAFELWPVRYVNDPRVIAQEDGFVSINSTISVDLMGQCASETSTASTTPPAAARRTSPAARCTRRAGRASSCSTRPRGGTISKIVAQLEPGDVVTTLKNTVDKVVTSGAWPSCGAGRCGSGVALIGIAHPDHRDRLAFDAKRFGHL